MPWGFIIAGMILAACIIALDCWLVRTGASFRTPVLAVAVGIYLPLELSVPIFIGGLVHWFATRMCGANSISRNGLLFASGLITGEALMGIVLAIPVVILKQFDIALPLWNMPFGAVVGIVLVGFAAMALYKSSIGVIQSNR
jgi:uncharacterized oligopeptide transporter (OPT) family protein